MTLPAVFLCTIVVAAITVSGCSERGDSAREDSLTAEPKPNVAAPPAQAGVAVTLDAPASVQQGAPVPLTLRLQNETSAPIDLYLRGREVTFDILVTDSTGDAVWRRLEDEVIPAILQVRTVAPNEVIELRHTWGQVTQRGDRVPAGRYRIRANVLTDGTTQLLSNEVAVEITSS